MTQCKFIINPYTDHKSYLVQCRPGCDGVRVVDPLGDVEDSSMDSPIASLRVWQCPKCQRMVAIEYMEANHEDNAIITAVWDGQRIF